MRKISEQKKVELLETAVLKNDIAAVKEHFEEYSEFEFTARALGLAMRFCGSEMVKALLENGASLSYPFTPTLKRKYECKVKANGGEDLPVDYARYVFPAYEVKGYDRKIVSDEERAASVRLLFEKKEGDFQEILYYSILYDDQVVYDILQELGVRRISEYRTDIVAGRVPNNRLDSCGLYYRYEFQECVFGDDELEVSEEKTVHILKRYLDCMDVDIILMSPSDFYEPDFNSTMVRGKFGKRFLKKYCSQTMFDFFVKYTNLVEKVKKWDLLYALVDQNNASGLQYALSEKWISKSNDIDALLSYSQENNAGTELIGYILEKQNKSDSTGRKKKSAIEDLSLDGKAISAAEIKKSWGFKKLEDGTIIITSYKGNNTDVVIPAAIGKDTVTAIDSDTFSTKAPRITESQKKIRTAITSVEFPGTIKTIPAHIFYDGYTGYYNNTKAPHAKLRRIVINEGTQIIASKAFEYCNGLQEIVLPESISVIGDSAFDGCWSLTKINLPKSITKLSNHMFARCGFESFEIPNHIISFGNGVFNNCWNLTSIKMSDEVTEIPGSMFAMCRALKQFTIPKSVVTIGFGAFSNSSLEEIIIPDTVASIGDSAFADCKQLKKVSFSENVQLGESVFTGCDSLANEKGQIVVNGILFGVNDPKSGNTLSVEGAITPLVIGAEIKRIAVNRGQLPEIVYKEHSETGVSINVEELSVGDEVCFGRFPQKDDYEMRPLKWRVIAKEDGKALLITVQSIISLNTSNQELIQTGVWKNYSVRKMLNKGFYHTAFTEIEQKQIITTTLDNPKNKAQRVDGGPETKDKVFLLSFDEVEKYMPTVLDKRATATEYAHNQYHAKRDIGFWQLRTPGKDSWGSVAVSETGETFAMTGNHVGYSYLRPAIWIK